MGYVKKTTLLLQSLYPDQEREFLSRMSDYGWNFSLIKLILDDLMIIPQRTLSIYLEKFGLNVVDVFVSSEGFQRRWEKTFYPQNDKFISKILKDIKPSSKIGFFSKEDFYVILAKQISYYKPDVVLVPSFFQLVNHYFFSKLKKFFNFKLVGWVEATHFNLNHHILSYDIVFSIFLPYVFKLREFGVKAEYLLLSGFDPVIIEKLKEKNSGVRNQQKKYDIVFIGSLHQVHRSRIPFLRKIADAFGDKFHIWTQSFSSLPSELRKNFRGAVFNIDYYYVLSKSKIVLNHHGSILPWAHNLRLFETTGVGSFF